MQGLRENERLWMEAETQGSDGDTVELVIQPDDADYAYTAHADILRP